MFLPMMSNPSHFLSTSSFFHSFGSSFFVFVSFAQSITVHILASPAAECCPTKLRFRDRPLGECLSLASSSRHKRATVQLQNYNLAWLVSRDETPHRVVN
jgi:hypothetical protein